MDGGPVRDLSVRLGGNLTGRSANHRRVRIRCQKREVCSDNCVFRSAVHCTARFVVFLLEKLRGFDLLVATVVVVAIGTLAFYVYAEIVDIGLRGRKN